MLFTKAAKIICKNVLYFTSVNKLRYGLEKCISWDYILFETFPLKKSKKLFELRTLHVLFKTATLTFIVNTVQQNKVNTCKEQSVIRTATEYEVRVWPTKHFFFLGLLIFNSLYIPLNIIEIYIPEFIKQHLN